MNVQIPASILVLEMSGVDPVLDFLLLQVSAPFIPSSRDAALPVTFPGPQLDQKWVLKGIFQAGEATDLSGLEEEKRTAFN